MGTVSSVNVNGVRAAAATGLLRRPAGGWSDHAPVTVVYAS